MAQVALLRKLRQFFYNDWVKAMIVMALGPFIFLYISTAVVCCHHPTIGEVNQGAQVKTIRSPQNTDSKESKAGTSRSHDRAIVGKYEFNSTSSDGSIEKQDPNRRLEESSRHTHPPDENRVSSPKVDVTGVRRKSADILRKADRSLGCMLVWNWTSVLVKVIWLGVFVVVLVVGIGKAVNIFLAELNAVLETLPLTQVTLIFVAVGVFMFLLPPVPGVPVYLAGGVCLTNAAWKQGEGPWSFRSSVYFTIIVCFGSKLLAFACQQKLIGERMGHSVEVRTLVCVNSITIKAIKFILQKPGLTLQKV